MKPIPTTSFTIPYSSIFFSIHTYFFQGETICNATGWGLTSGIAFVPPNALHWVQLPIHSHEFCLDSDFQEYITEGMVCAGSSAQSTCNVTSTAC